MRRVRIVLETNTLIAALISKGTPPDQLYQAWLRQIELVADKCLAISLHHAA